MHQHLLAPAGRNLQWDLHTSSEGKKTTQCWLWECSWLVVGTFTLTWPHTLSGQFKPVLCIDSSKPGFGFQHVNLPNSSCRHTPQLDSRIKRTFKRCWIGVCSNFSLTTNVNSYQRQSNSKPADAVNVHVLSYFKHRGRVSMGAESQK